MKRRQLPHLLSGIWRRSEVQQTNLPPTAVLGLVDTYVSLPVVGEQPALTKFSFRQTDDHRAAILA